MDFTLEELISLLWKRIVLIVLCTIAGLCLAFVLSRYMIKPSYTASVQMYVNPNDSESSANLNELNYAQKVVNTYISFLQTKQFYKQVVEKSELNFTPDKLKNMTHIQSVNNTEIFEISVTADHPYEAFRFVEVMQEIVPELIQSIKTGTKIRIVDPAVMPEKPSAPNIMVNTMVGGASGLLASIIGSIIWEIINIKVNNKEDLLKRYELPILGMIPSFEERKNTKETWHKLITWIRTRKWERKNDYLLNDNSNFIITEAYKTLRTNLRFTLRGSGCKKIIVSSPTPEDGKTTTSINLAIAIAQTGAKVLVMDCDLRKGRIHQYFKIKNTLGLSDILSGMVDEKKIIKETEQNNINVIPLGRIPPNPTELLASTQMEELLGKLDQLYDYIIIDTPPVNIVSDALSLTKLTDGVLIVVREGVTTYPNISGAINKYEFAQANILGFVINGISLHRGNKSKSNYYYQHASRDD